MQEMQRSKLNKEEEEFKHRYNNKNWNIKKKLKWQKFKLKFLLKDYPNKGN